jgi:hypothetical protein
MDTRQVALGLECPDQRTRVSGCLSADELRPHSLGLISP